MKALILDASAALATLLEDERSERALEILQAVEKSSSTYVPSHWWLELANGLLMAERRRRAPVEKINKTFELAQTLPVIIDEETAFHCSRQTLQLARRHGVTLYDAAYLELAIRRDCTLATLDAGLSRAAKSAAVALLL